MGVHGRILGTDEGKVCKGIESIRGKREIRKRDGSIGDGMRGKYLRVWRV